jgi:hypothetical protein
MPPKKGKKSKEEKEAEKLALEEEARKARILEEKRQAEEAERHRQEEIQFQLAQKKNREAEIQRFKEEFDELQDYFKTFNQQLGAEEKRDVNKIPC